MSGCTVYRDPSVSVVGATVTQTADGLLGLDFSLVMENPNEHPLALHEFNYTLAVDGAVAYRGRWAASATLPASGTRRLSIPAVVRYNQAGRTSSSGTSKPRYDLAGHVLYLVPGEIAEILFDMGVRKPKASFAAQGVLDLTPPDDGAEAQDR